MKTEKHTRRQQIGILGEKIACNFLERKGFMVIERNYLRKWGEIDVIAQKSNILHFIEVKSVSCVTHTDVSCENTFTEYRRTRQTAVQTRLDDASSTESVTHGTHKDRMGEFRPEDNLHHQKLKRLQRTIETYLLEKKINPKWQLDLITVKIDQKSSKAAIKVLANIV